MVAQNRRAGYTDGSARMYCPTDAIRFRGLEGYEDHTLEVLFFWDFPISVWIEQEVTEITEWSVSVFSC